MTIFAAMEATPKPISKRGGRREGAGRSKQYGEQTATLCFRVPQTHREKITAMVRVYLEGLKLEYKSKKHDPEYGC
jgi:hypothetical protein